MARKKSKPTANGGAVVPDTGPSEPTELNAPLPHPRDGLWRLPPWEKKFDVTPRQLGSVVPWGITYLGIPELQKKTTGVGLKVGILDTGIDLKHPDFDGQIIESRDFTGSKWGVADLIGHGTHTAGSILAKNNGQGAVGIAYGAKGVIGKVLGDDSSGRAEWIAAGIDWVTSFQINVLSLSLGAPEGHPLILAALQRAVAAGVLVVCAAGNEGQERDGFGRLIDRVGYPAKWGTVAQAVAAIDQKGKVTAFSSPGPEVDVAAPGAHILSCWPGNRYAYLDGTSMATPYVAGGLLLAMACRKLRAAPAINGQNDLGRLIKETSKPLEAGPVPSPLWGNGLFNPSGLCDYGVAAKPGVLKLGPFVMGTYSIEITATPI